MENLATQNNLFKIKEQAQRKLDEILESFKVYSVSRSEIET